jgi:energy-coupling factor transporter ATP-binding protein EcfA2
VELIKDVHQENGLCVLAHLDSTNSLRYTWHQLAKDILGLVDPLGKIPAASLSEVSEKFKTLLAGLDIDGVEVSKPDHRKHYSWIQDRDGRRRNIPVLLTLDAHSIEELARTDRHCYVKMTDVSFDGLRAALKMPHTRIRFSNDLQMPPSPALLGLSLTSSKGDGFFQDAILSFSENLNCIIGPRGSGKSTLIDALRYVFGYNKTLGELEGDPGLIKAIKGRQEQNLRDTIIRVFYQREDREVHVLEATYDKKSDYVTKVYTLEGHPVGVDDVEKSGDYPLRLFGWSEIETIGRSATHQRELVDRLIPGLPELVGQRQELRDALRTNAEELLKIGLILKNLFEKNNQIIAHFTEYTEDFARLNTPEMQNQFASLDLVRRKQRAIELVIEAFDGHLTGLRDLDPSRLTAQIEQGTARNAGIAKEYVSLIRHRSCLLRTNHHFSHPVNLDLNPLLAVGQRLKCLPRSFRNVNVDLCLLRAFLVTNRLDGKTSKSHFVEKLLKCRTASRCGQHLSNRAGSQCASKRIVAVLKELASQLLSDFFGSIHCD